MTVPDDLMYTAEHEWIRVEGDEIVVGVTEFAQGELGDVVFQYNPRSFNHSKPTNSNREFTRSTEALPTS